MKRYRIIELSVALALVISVVTSIVGFANDCNDIRNNVIRLHILANSDSPEDQEIKLKVRDELLECGSELFSGKMNRENSEEILADNINDIQYIINGVLADNGFDYGCEIYLTDEYFETREYEDFTMPAGEYRALKIILGEGGGHNWWCVMFPPLCLPAAKDNASIDAVFTDNSADIIANSGKYEVRFRIIELIEELRLCLMAK